MGLEKVRACRVEAGKKDTCYSAPEGKNRSEHPEEQATIAPLCTRPGRTSR